MTGTNAKHITVQVSAQYPNDLVDDPTSGPTLKEFLRGFFTRFDHPDDHLAQNGEARLTYKTYTHGPDVKSVVFTDFWNLGGAHPNDEINTFTFDFKTKKPLTIADLFCSGTDPLTALPPLVRPYVQQAVDPQGGPSSDLSQYEPGGHGINYADDYKAWYLDGDDLVLVMPSARSGPADAGMWQPHIPLSALQTILRDGGCTA